MAEKHLGTCPFCKELVTPYVVEGNVIRRDKCMCPNCQNTVYVCRAPGCDDYARGGDIYDDEFCPSCTASATEGGATAIKGAVAAALVAVITNAISKHDSDDSNSFF